MEKLSFNKRIMIVKKTVFDGATESGELNKIKGSNDSGFYSIATITKYLYPALYDNDLDLDLEIFKSSIVATWIDCNSDKTRKFVVDFSRIINQSKLQMMAHEVQSEGAIKSYTRRYALSAILGLPSTDLIDSDNNKTYKKSKKPQETKPQEQKPQDLSKVTLINQKQINLLMATLEGHRITDEQIKTYIKRFYKVDSKKKLTVYQLNEILCSLKKIATKKQMDALFVKAEKFKLSKQDIEQMLFQGWGVLAERTNFIQMCLVSEGLET